MIQLSGIFSESLGGTCTIRGYAKYNEIVELSYPHPGYQRPAEDEHVAEISSFITSGSNSFSPEVVLAYTAKYNYYAQGASSEVDALADIRSGKGFTSNVDGIAFKKEKAAGNGFLYTLSIPDKKYDRIEDKPFRRVDGNHRLLAIEKLIAEGQMRSNYLIPFCIIVFPDNVSMKDEKIIFHNINSKAVPIRSERLLEGIIVDSKDELSFSDKELDDSFGHEYLLARKVLKNKPLAIRKLKAIPWIRSDLITALIDIIESIQKRFGNIQTAEHEEAFGIALSNALNDAKPGENGTLLISSGLLFLLVALYYNIEISSPSADAVQYKDRLLTWSEKYQITDAQIDTEQNAASNAECIEAIFNRYVRSTEQTIFMSRCFSAEYNETENAIRRAINEINKLITWANKLIQMNFSFDLFKMLVQCDARISKAAKTQLKVYLKQRIDAAKNKNNNGVVVYPTKQPYEELDQVGYWCLLNVLKAKDFQEFLGNSEAFDFYCEYAKFDFSRFDVSWLLNLYPHTLEQIAKNAKVKERVRVAIATTLDGEAIAPSDSQRLQSILVKHFC